MLQQASGVVPRIRGMFATPHRVVAGVAVRVGEAVAEDFVVGPLCLLEEGYVVCPAGGVASSSVPWRRRRCRVWPVIGRLEDVWGDLLQASRNIPEADRVALCPTKKDAFDLTSAQVFLDDTQYQQRVVDLLKEYYPNCKAPNGAIKVYTVVPTMLLALTHLHTVWRKKDYHSDVDVEEAERWAKKLGQCWKLMGWKATVWVHWTVCHSGWFVRKYRTMYVFSSVPTERRNSAYKVHLQNSFRGWSVKNPRVSVRGILHLLNMSRLDVGLKRVGSQSRGAGRGQKRNRSE